jgi:hypothetical protein
MIDERLPQQILQYKAKRHQNLGGSLRKWNQQGALRIPGLYNWRYTDGQLFRHGRESIRLIPDGGYVYCWQCNLRETHATYRSRYSSSIRVASPFLSLRVAPTEINADISTPPRK